jgi:hypothetical protein
MQTFCPVGQVCLLSLAEWGASLQTDRSTLLEVLLLPSFLMAEASAAKLKAARGAVCDGRHSAFEPPAGRGQASRQSMVAPGLRRADANVSHMTSRLKTQHAAVATGVQTHFQPADYGSESRAR